MVGERGEAATGAGNRLPPHRLIEALFIICLLACAANLLPLPQACSCLTSNLRVNLRRINAPRTSLAMCAAALVTAVFEPKPASPARRQIPVGERGTCAAVNANVRPRARRGLGKLFCARGGGRWRKQISIRSLYYRYESTRLLQPSAASADGPRRSAPSRADPAETR